MIGTQPVPCTLLPVAEMFGLQQVPARDGGSDLFEMAVIGQG